MHEGATGCGDWAMQGLGVCGLANDAALAFIGCWSRALRFGEEPGSPATNARVEIRRRGEQAERVRETEVMRPWGESVEAQY